VTAADALADYRLRLRVSSATGRAMGTVVSALTGKPSRCSAVRAGVLAALQAEGVDVSTIPRPGERATGHLKVAQ
jgi:hypothetical protein